LGKMAALTWGPGVLQSEGMWPPRGRTPNRSGRRRIRFPARQRGGRTRPGGRRSDPELDSARGRLLRRLHKTPPQIRCVGGGGHRIQARDGGRAAGGGGMRRHLPGRRRVREKPDAACGWEEGASLRCDTRPGDAYLARPWIPRLAPSVGPNLQPNTVNSSHRNFSPPATKHGPHPAPPDCAMKPPYALILITSPIGLFHFCTDLLVFTAGKF